VCFEGIKNAHFYPCLRVGVTKRGLNETPDTQRKISFFLKKNKNKNIMKLLCKNNYENFMKML
jgi:hypothetical protein